MTTAPNFGAALGALFKSLALTELAIAAVPLRAALTNIQANPSIQNAVAQGAVLAVALPAALPNAEKTAISAVAGEALTFLNIVFPAA